VSEREKSLLEDKILLEAVLDYPKIKELAMCARE